MSAARPWLAAAVSIAGALAAVPRTADAAELGVNVHQSATTGPAAAHDAKLGWVRVDMNWVDIEAVQGKPDFSVLDAAVDAATSRGLQVLAILAYTPAWASTGDTMHDGPNNDVPVAGAYASFVKAAVTRYAPRVTHYEIWNEANLAQFWEGTVDQYTSGILVPGADAVHAACPSCIVAGPALATVGGQYDTWLDAALRAAQGRLDVVSGHIYAGFPADDPSLGKLADSFFNKLESHRIVTIGSTVVYEGPLSFFEVMKKDGVTKPFWLTETGTEAAYGDATAEAAQATYYRHVLEAMLTRPQWPTTLFYEAFDEPGTGYTYGICLDDPAQPAGYDAKPVMGLLQKAISEQPVFGGQGTDCEDGLDNDGDGLVDYPADPDCTGPTSPSEGLPPVDAGADARGNDAGVDAAADAAADATTNGGPAAPASGGCAVVPGGDAARGAGALVPLALLVLSATRRRASRAQK